MSKIKKYIYIISNPVFPGFLKIGKNIDIKRRLVSYNTCDPLRGYKCEYLVHVGDPSLYESIFIQHGNSEWTQIALSDCIKLITELKEYEQANHFEDDGIIAINQHQWRYVPRTKYENASEYKKSHIKTFICVREGCGCLKITTKIFNSKPRRITFSTVYDVSGSLYKEEHMCLLHIK